MTDNITLPRSVVEQTIEAMRRSGEQRGSTASEFNAIEALRAALEQPPVEQEPVAYFYTRSGRVVSTEATDALMQQMIGESGRVALYAHPQPKREPLTDEQIVDSLIDLPVQGTGYFIRIARAIERAHGIGGEA